jgi:hypothetical protein
MVWTPIYSFLVPEGQY